MIQNPVYVFYRILTLWKSGSRTQVLSYTSSFSNGNLGLGSKVNTIIFFNFHSFIEEKHKIYATGLWMEK